MFEQQRTTNVDLVFAWCPNCGIHNYFHRLERNVYVCEDCKHQTLINAYRHVLKRDLIDAQKVQ